MKKDKLKGCGKRYIKPFDNVCGQIDPTTKKRKFYCPECLAKFKGRKEALEEILAKITTYDIDISFNNWINSELEELNEVLK